MIRVQNNIHNETFSLHYFPIIGMYPIVVLTTSKATCEKCFIRLNYEIPKMNIYRGVHLDAWQSRNIKWWISCF